MTLNKNRVRPRCALFQTWPISVHAAVLLGTVGIHPALAQAASAPAQDTAPIARQTIVAVEKNNTPKPAKAAGHIPHTQDWGVFNAGKQAASGFGTMAGFGQVRWAEDWSDLANVPVSKRNKDWFNRLKYIRLNTTGSIWLSLSGEERLRYVFENQPMMGTAGKTNANRVLLRNMYGADLHLGEHVRAYAEFLWGVAGGSNYYGYQAGTQRERLDLQQGILEVKGHLLGASMGVIGGRQVFVDAPVSMQSARDLPNVQQTWDGVRGYAVWKSFRVDLFDFMQTNKKPIDVFADGTSYNARMYGAYTSTALPSFSFMKQKSQLFADVFFLGYLFNGANAALPLAQAGKTEAGSTRRDNIGGRLWGNAGPFDINLTGVFQGGQFRPAQKDAQTRPVRAFAVNGSISWNAKNLLGKPSFGIQADVFSGGNYNSKNGAVGTFATPYVALPYYNDVTLALTSQNLVGVGPLITAAPKPNLRLRLHVPAFWRESTQDAVYGTGKTYAWRNNLHGGFVGVSPQVQVAWSFAPHFTWMHDIAGFASSHGMREAGAKSGMFYMQTMEFKF